MPRARDGHEPYTQTRTLEPGKWSLYCKLGHQVSDVRLVGLRGRKHPLMRIDEKDFVSRTVRSPSGEITENVVTRGVPSAWAGRSNQCWLWPAPAHQWQIEMDITPPGAGKTA